MYAEDLGIFSEATAVQSPVAVIDYQCDCDCASDCGSDCDCDCASDCGPVEV